MVKKLQQCTLMNRNKVELKKLGTQEGFSEGIFELNVEEPSKWRRENVPGKILSPKVSRN